MQEKNLPSDWKCCATCSCWAGCVRSDYARQWITFIDRKDKCCGGGFHNCDMDPMSYCSSWQQRFKPNK